MAALLCVFGVLHCSVEGPEAASAAASELIALIALIAVLVFVFVFVVGRVCT